MEYRVAKSYEGYELVGEPFEKSGKLYTKAKCKCDRCGGSGMIVAYVCNGQPVPIPVDGGVCYKCGGSGTVRKEIRLYTEKERAALDRQAEKREEKRQQEQEERIAKLNEQSEDNKKEWFAKNGFNEKGVTYSVAGNSYEIKDKLKELGCVFSPILKWHCATPIELPEDYKLIKFDFEELYEWNAQMKNAFFFESAKTIVERRFAEAEGPSLSEYMGEVGERLRNLTAIYKSSRGFEGAYGYTHIHTFERGDNILVWFTTKDLNFEKGQVVDLTGTVKKHEEFRGVKTTQLSRCIIKEVK